MFLEFTNTKMSNNNKLLQPSSPLWLISHIVTLKPPSCSLPISPPSPLHSFLLPPVPPARETSSPSYSLDAPIETNLPRLHQHRNKHLLNCTFSKSLTNT